MSIHYVTSLILCFVMVLAVIGFAIWVYQDRPNPPSKPKPKSFNDKDLQRLMQNEEEYWIEYMHDVEPDDKQYLTYTRWLAWKLHELRQNQSVVKR